MSQKQLCVTSLTNPAHGLLWVGTDQGAIDAAAGADWKASLRSQVRAGRQLHVARGRVGLVPRGCALF